LAPEINLFFFLKKNEDLKELLEEEREKTENLKEEIKDIQSRKDNEIRQLTEQFYAIMAQQDLVIKRLEAQTKQSSRMVFVFFSNF
jgi:predicted  nucleic acid-binding Zn-ribbon protein